jgi:CelD/BcsL family acetyltransferase involved in cellulose biosynthesis
MAERNLTLSRAKRDEDGGARPLGSTTQYAERRGPAAATTDLPSVISPPLSAAMAQLPDPAAEPGVDLQFHGDLAEVEHEWKAFETRAERTVFQTFDWLAKWQRHIGARRKARPAIVLGRDRDGHLLFILQFAIEARGPVRCLTWLGSELCDYNAPLLAEHFSDSVNAERFVLIWRDVIKRLRAEPRFRFDFVDLEKMPETVGAQANPFLNIKVRANPSGAYVANLGPDWEEFYAAKRSSSTRKRERRQLKHLAEHGNVRFVEVADKGDIAQTLTTLIDQKSKSFNRMGVDDMFARPGYREFFLDIATDLNVRALTHVSRLDVGSTTAAINLGLQFRNSYYLVLSSYHDGELSRFGPGRAHLHELLRHAIEQGFQKFDFTIGDEPYKRDWSDLELRLYDHLAAVTIRGALLVAATAAFRRTKRFIKQTPMVWHAYLRAREVAGLLSQR